jgi:hypothetical protein
MISMLMLIRQNHPITIIVSSLLTAKELMEGHIQNMTMFQNM